MIQKKKIQCLVCIISILNVLVAWYKDNDFLSSDTMGSQPLFVTEVHGFTHKDCDIKIVFNSVIS